VGQGLHLNPAHVTSISSGSEGREFDVWIDDVAFIK
jgi:hypothetical protein